MALFKYKVTFTDNTPDEVIEADEYTEAGNWFVFEEYQGVGTNNKIIARLRSDQIDRIDAVS